MTNAPNMLELLSTVENLARGSRWKRFCHQPFKYLASIFYRDVLFKILRRKWITKTRLFWGQEIRIALPSSMDLYLTGGKSDDAEIRLTKFIVRHLGEGDHFFDIGAHAGYYTLLAAQLTAPDGKILCAEPSADTYSLLKSNIAGITSIQSISEIILDVDDMVDFFEFPVMYAEYNTIDVAQYSSQKWYRIQMPVRRKVKASRGDSMIQQYGLNPTIIKIDTEGAEKRVVAGLSNFLQSGKAYIAMEFLGRARHNQSHIEAEQLLQKAGYAAHRIDQEGELILLNISAADYLEQLHIESDNIVYVKQREHIS